MPDVRLVNLNTGEEMTADHYRLVELGMPDGYRSLDSVSKEELWERLRKLLRERGQHGK